VEYLVEHDLEIVVLLLIEVDEQDTLRRKEMVNDRDPRAHHREPSAMLKTIVVMLERLLRVEGRVNVDALDPPRELLLQRLEGQEVVAEDEAVVEEVVVGDAEGGVA